MSPIALVDTHVLIYWLLQPRKVSRTAARRLADPGHEFRISVASLLESMYLIEIGRVDAQWTEILGWITGQQSWEVVPFDALVLSKARDVATRDPFDRMIVATALAHDWRLLTKDDWIHRSYPKLALW